MKHIFRLTAFPACLLAIAFLLLPADACNAEPHRLLGEEGAYFWSQSGDVVYGLFPINNSQRVMQVWSSRLAENGSRHVFMQIVNNDGSTVFEQPFQLNLPEMSVISGSATSDREGNIYAAWLSNNPWDPFYPVIFVQKFNPDGEL